ncbi:L-fucose-proton symporter [termite gut metagenome]|uniref:L-fucose-proton symporter n=1 Tax=termite gut metagenome TaxID=433724 RepID=A0A5J4RDX2_9ZZZZ
MAQQNTQSLKIGMALMAMIFFILGFITNSNMALKDQVQATFELSATMAQLVNGVFFFAYFCFSLICGGFIKRIGYKNGIIVGMLLVALGSYLFYPAVAGIPSYPLFLTAIFIMATGVVFLQTAANPYVVALGTQETASARLTLVQAMNSIATTIAPFLVGLFILTPASLAMGPKAVQLPFIIIGTLVLLIALGIYLFKLPPIENSEFSSKKKVWQHPQVLLGALGIFCYVGAEVGCSTQIVPYLESSGFVKDEAGRLVAIYWAGGMIGRFLGSIMLSTLENSKKYIYSSFIILFSFFVGWFIFSSSIVDGTFVFNSQHFNGLMFLGIAVVNFLAMLLGNGNPNLSLGIFGITGAALVLVAFFAPVSIGMWTLLAVGFFNSIMFPTIFSLGVRDLDASEMPLASGIINTLIVGGAVVPLATGWFTDNISIRSALILPIICFSYIAFFGLKGSKIR